MRNASVNDEKSATVNMWREEKIMNNKAVEKWIDDHQDDLIKDIMDLCRIPSVEGEPQEGMPFGPEPCKALAAALKKCEEYGFTVKNYDNYVGTADLDPSLPRTLEILGHMDVVPAGNGWTVTEPFEPVVKDGKIYGRGTSDDKGPSLCALYAMRALKECNVPLKKGIRMILGSAEETGSNDIPHYYEKEGEAEMTFSPDAEFPIINIEKGQFRGTLSRKFEESTALPRLLSLEAGIALNAVPQEAVLVTEGIDPGTAEEAAKAVEAQYGVTIAVSEPAAQKLSFTVTGVSAHASTPEGGVNAGLAAVALALKLPLAGCEQLELLKKIPELFPWKVTDGAGIGIKMSDPESHDLTCTPDLFHVTTTECSFSFDARTPVCAVKENCQDKAQEIIEKAGFDFSTPGMVPPHCVSGDSPFVQTLLAAYEDVTGLKGECLAIGGGTYVHDLKNGVAFGAVLPDIDTRMHGADEFMPIDNIMTAAKVYAEAMIRLCS